MPNMILLKNGGRSLALGLILGVSVSGCDSLLEVELPHILTDAAIEGEGTAELQVNSGIALFECGFNAFGLIALGAEDVMESVAGVAGGMHRYDEGADTGTCDTVPNSDAWWDGVMGSRALLSNSDSRFHATSEGSGTGVYDRIQDDWSLGAEGERLSAIAAIYVAAALTHFGEFLCETAVDGSVLIAPNDMLAMSDAWITRAEGHVGADFAMPFGVASSISNMATAMRARNAWARDDFAAANGFATTVLAADPAFNAWITREAGETRRNKIFVAVTDVSYSGGLGVNDWWQSALRAPNPATGMLYPDVIPFTGYFFMGIMPDGRTLEAGQLPVVWADEVRDGAGDPVPNGNGSVPDTRVPHIFKTIQGSSVREVPANYSAETDDIPYISWRELRLMQADFQRSTGDLAGAIATVNMLRTAAGVTPIAGGGAYETTLLGSAAEVRYMLMEERRREFYAEGAARYWATKIRNTDLAWFPRGQGATPDQGYNYEGAVRQHMPNNEFDSNPNITNGRADRATLCPVAERPAVTT